jgi:hypothetical protein
VSEFCLNAIDHDGLETLVLRVLKAIAESDRREWAAIVGELRKHDLTDPFEEEPLTGRRIPPWDDPRLVLALRTLTQIRARHTFVGSVGRMNGWLVDLPLRVAFRNEGEKREFAEFDTLILRSGHRFPRHLEFLDDPDAQCSYVLPGEVARLGCSMADNGYLVRAGRYYASESEEQVFGRFLADVAVYIMRTAAEGHALYYRELGT